MLKPTTTTLKKLEELLEELGYEVRYEKGSFHSGHCLVEARRVAVVNRFFDTEGRVNALFEITAQLAPDPGGLSEKGRETLRRALKTLQKNTGTGEAELSGPIGEADPESAHSAIRNPHSAIE